jgi:transposase-like protein
MGKKRVRHSAEFKGKVALEALKGVQTVNELAGHYQIHPTQISQWKRQVQG